MDLRYFADVDSLGRDSVVLTASDGYLEGTASSPVSLEWPRGPETRPPTVALGAAMVWLPEDGEMPLGPVGVRFGDGRSVVVGRARCSAGSLSLGGEAGRGGGDVRVIEAGTGDDAVTLRGLPEDVGRALSAATYVPPKDWNSRAKGAVTLTVDVEAPEDGEVRRGCAPSSAVQRVQRGVVVLGGGCSVSRSVPGVPRSMRFCPPRGGGGGGNGGKADPAL